MARERAASPADFRIRWQNDFLKAQQGTFVPFTLVIEAAGALPGSRPRLRPGRAAGGRRGRRIRTPGRGSAAAGRKPTTSGGEYPVDAIFPVELKPDGSHVARVSRGFSIAPGDYNVYVVVRERPSVDGAQGGSRGRRC